MNHPSGIEAKRLLAFRSPKRVYVPTNVMQAFERDHTKSVQELILDNQQIHRDDIIEVSLSDFFHLPEVIAGEYEGIVG